MVTIEQLQSNMDIYIVTIKLLQSITDIYIVTIKLLTIKSNNYGNLILKANRALKSYKDLIVCLSPKRYQTMLGLHKPQLQSLFDRWMRDVNISSTQASA